MEGHGHDGEEGLHAVGDGESFDFAIDVNQLLRVLEGRELEKNFLTQEEVVECRDAAEEEEGGHEDRRDDLLF